MMRIITKTVAELKENCLISLTNTKLKHCEPKTRRGDSSPIIEQFQGKRLRKPPLASYPADYLIDSSQTQSKGI